MVVSAHTFFCAPSSTKWLSNLRASVYLCKPWGEWLKYTSIFQVWGQSSRQRGLRSILNQCSFAASLMYNPELLVTKLWHRFGGHPKFQGYALMKLGCGSKHLLLLKCWWLWQISSPSELIMRFATCVELCGTQGIPGWMQRFCISRVSKAINCLLSVKHVKLSTPHLSNRHAWNQNSFSPSVLPCSQSKAWMDGGCKWEVTLKSISNI